MSTKNNMLTDISAELDKEFGAPEIGRASCRERV